MANYRVTSNSLAPVPVQQGQILKGEHLALLKVVFSTGINANKHDIDRIIAGDVDAYIFYDTPTNSGLSYLENLVDVPVNTNGFVVTQKEIQYYIYNGSNWEFQTELSLLNLYGRIQLLEAATGVDTGFIGLINDMLDSINGRLDDIEQRLENLPADDVLIGVPIFNSIEDADESEIPSGSGAFIVSGTTIL